MQHEHRNCYQNWNPNDDEPFKCLTTMDKSALIQTLSKFKIGLQRGTVSLLDYTHQWHQAFIFIKEYIRPSVENAEIIHIGSTAIPGSKAKPILDLLIVHDPTSNFSEQAYLLTIQGFINKGAYGFEGRTYLTLNDDSLSHSFVHIHAYPKAHEHVQRLLTFKRILQDHPDLVRQYSQEKLHLIQQGINRKDYPEAKTPFVERILNTYN